MRSYYDLERIWFDAKVVKYEVKKKLINDFLQDYLIKIKLNFQNGA